VLPIDKFGEYLAGGGGRGLERAFELGQSGTIDEITRSGLRGRGGAGFSTGRKWASVRNNGDWTPVNESISIESPYHPELGKRTYEKQKLHTRANHPTVT